MAQTPVQEDLTFQNIYNIESKTGRVDVEDFGSDDSDEKKDTKKSSIATYPSGSAVTDLSAQVDNMMKVDATTNELYFDSHDMDTNIYQGIAAANYDTNRAKSQAYSFNNTTKHFSNVSQQNNNPFYKNIGGNTISATTTAADIYGAPFGGGGLGAFASGMIGTILGGGFPLATAMSWIGYGLQQNRDKNNFIKKLKGGMDGILNLESDYKSQVPSAAGPMTFRYALHPDKTPRQFMSHILFNSHNPGYFLKKHAEYGKRPQEALKNFINEGVDKGVFNQQDIIHMGSSRHKLKAGSDDYMKAWAAQKALKEKGYAVRGRVAIAPDGTQYLDGQVWTRSDLSGVVKNQLGQGKAQNQVSNLGQKDNEAKRTNFRPTVEKQTSTGGSPHRGFTSFNKPSKGSASLGQGASKMAKRARTGPDLTRRQEGGPIGNPMGEQQPQMPIQDAGNLEMVNEPNKDMSGVADDVPRELNEGDFVINAPAVEMAGRGDIERMISRAVTELQRKGVKLDFGQAAEDADSIVKALVSNKEMIIPKVIAEQIGYDPLEKINNRGKERVNEIEEEQQAEQQQIQGNPQAQGMMGVQMGGQIALDENKNQPIAVPRESFAGQSTVGRKLLSPMSPESQDDEAELENKSQSFEGFLKPIKMNEGEKVKKKIPLSVDANNWFSIHRNPGVDWEGRKAEGDRKHTVIEEFYDPIDSVRAVYRMLMSRSLRTNQDGFISIKNLFDKNDEIGSYAKDSSPYMKTLKDFGYTEDSVIDLKNTESTVKFLNYLASIEIGRDYYSNSMDNEMTDSVIRKGIEKGYNSILNDENYKYKEQFNTMKNKPIISIEFMGDKKPSQNMYGGMLSVN